jgi:small subunit ribosomal protein S4
MADIDSLRLLREKWDREFDSLRKPGAAEKLRQLFDATPEELAAAANRARLQAKLESVMRKRRRSKALRYGLQLHEKQPLLRQLELRLDNVVYALGFATSRARSRQLVRHGHIEVNGKTIHVPSYEVQAGDVIQVREKSRIDEQIRAAVETADSVGVPAWLELDADQFRGIVINLPKREDLPLPIHKGLGDKAWSK